MRLIITTFDPHVNLLEANKYLMDKYWPKEISVTVLGFNRPDFELVDWKFVSMGTYESANNWTKDIYPFFETFEDEYFIMGHDDVLLMESFDYEWFLEIVETVKTIKNFGRIFLTSPDPYFHGGIKQVIKTYDDGRMLIEFNDDAHIRLSLQFSLWKTSYFKKYLMPPKNPWDFELNEEAKNDGYAILQPLNKNIVNFGHVMQRGYMLDNWHRGVYGKYSYIGDNPELSYREISDIKKIFKKHGYEIQ